MADHVSATPVTPPGGINTGANPFAGDARGAMRQADNCVIPSRDKMESRRGSDLSSYAMSSAPSTIGEFYSDTLFAQHGTKLSRDTGSAFTEVGTHSPPSGASMKFIGTQGKEINGGLYFTTSAGVYGIDSTTATPKLSGIQRPGDFFIIETAGSGTRLTGNPNTGWMPVNAAVAGRAVLGRKDANNNIKLSAPSGRLVIVNPANLTIAIGSLVRNTNVVTATLTAGVAHSFRVGDIVDLTVSGGDVGNFDTTNNVVTSVTATTVVWAETAANYTNVAEVTVTSGTKNIQWMVDLPTEAAAGEFVQIYRTFDVTGATTDPGDECFLAYERVLTATDISNTFVTITDTTPSAFLGAPLMTNANSGDGEQAANHRPPLAKDVCLFDGRAFYANTTGRHRLNLRLLGTGSGVSGLQSGDAVAINTRVYVAGTNFSVFTEFTASLNIQRTIASLVYNTTKTGLGWKSYATHDGDNGTGGVLLEETGLASAFTDGTSGAINALYAGSSRASAWADAIAATVEVTEASTSRTGSTVTVTTATAHGFSSGAIIMLAYRADTVVDPDFPPGLKTITVTGGSTFTYTESGAADTMVGTYYVYATTFKSIADTLPIVYSKPGQPEAVPLLNFIQDIPRGMTVLRIASLREMLFVFLTNGDIWTVSGSYPYRVEKFDGTATLIAEASLVEHNNRLHCLTTQGVVAISEGGIEILDEAVRPELLPLIAAEQAAGTLGSTRAASYESEHQYRLYLSTTSSYAIWVYNSLYRRWTKQSDGRAWGVVRRSTNKLYEGHSTLGRFWLERKAYTRLDFADFIGTVDSGSTAGSPPNDTTTATGVNGALIGQIAVGDVLIPNFAAAITASQQAWTVTAVAAGGATVTASVNTNLYTDASPIGLGTFVTSSGPANLFIYRPIANTLQWLHDAMGAPHIEKQFRDLQLHFSRHSVASHSATFTAIDGSTAATGTIAAAAPQAYAFTTAPTLPISKRANVDDVTQYVTMTPQLAAGMTVSEVFSVWTLLGYTLDAEAGGERVMT